MAVLQFDLRNYTPIERTMIYSSLTLATEEGVRTQRIHTTIVTEAPQALVLSIIRDVVRQCHQDEVSGLLPESTMVIVD